MDTEITIIGAGVIGLAIAEKISEEYNDVFVIERHNTFGQETSSRNSDMIRITQTDDTGGSSSSWSTCHSSGKSSIALLLHPSNNMAASAPRTK